MSLTRDQLRHQYIDHAESVNCPRDVVIHLFDTVMGHHEKLVALRTEALAEIVNELGANSVVLLNATNLFLGLEAQHVQHLMSEFAATVSEASNDTA